MPWIALVVIDEEEAAARLSQRPGGLTVLTMAVARLPAADELSAFAHVQVTGDLPSNTDLVDRARPAGTRRGTRARPAAAGALPTLSGLPRAYVRSRAPGRPRRAGGRSAVADAGMAGRRGEVTLPVYREWSFGTGADPDIETVVRRLVERSAAQWPEPPSLDLSALGVKPARYRGILRPLAARPAALNDAAAESWSRCCRATPTSRPAAGRARVTLPWWGEGHGARRKGWSRTLNLDPRLRAPAGLGAELVRRRQDSSSMRSGARRAPCCGRSGC